MRTQALRAPWMPLVVGAGGKIEMESLHIMRDAARYLNDVGVKVGAQLRPPVP
jgi:hypothetical protein